MNLSLKSVPSSHALVGFVATANWRWTRCRTNAQTGSAVRLLGLKLPVHISWYYLKRSDGKLENALVLCTKALKGQHYDLVGSSPLASWRLFQDRKTSVWVTPLWARDTTRSTVGWFYLWPLICSLTGFTSIWRRSRIGVKQHSQLLNSFFHWWHYYHYWHRFNAYNL